MRGLIAAVAGGVLGFVYYKTIGCQTGACPLTSNPVISVFWGSTMGYLVVAP